MSDDDAGVGLHHGGAHGPGGAPLGLHPGGVQGGRAPGDAGAVAPAGAQSPGLAAASAAGSQPEPSVGRPEDDGPAAEPEPPRQELRNGRLAMLAFSGIATVGVLTQEKWPFFDAVVNATSRSVAPRSSSKFCGARTESRSRMVVRHASSSKSMPFLPKPQNLSGLVGAEAEFDPLGFSDTFDAFQQILVKWLRESELKHGRVCMLATVGFVAEQYIQFPGFPASEDALQAIYVAPVNMTALLLVIAGYIESSTYGGKLTMLDMFEGEGAKRAPGDLNFGKRFLPADKAAADELAMKELSNGRLAMLAFAGMVHHNLVVKGPLFPLFPEGWEGPQGSWDLDSTAGALNSGRLGL
eukprot:s3612_g8.t1